jgi:hypothetical protein
LKSLQTNPQAYSEYLQKLTKLNSLEIAVGFPKGKIPQSHYDNGASILDVAIWNEYGTSKTPRRPFLNQSNVALTSNYNKMYSSIVTDNKIKADSVEKELNKIALVSESIVKKTIRDGSYEPNAPSTIKRKGSSRPLIDTGAMLNAVTSVVRESSEDAL